MMKALYALSSCLWATSLLASLPAINFPWEGISDPSIMDRRFVRRFAELPRAGTIRDKNKLWSGDSWPLYKGNINHRWYADGKNGLDFPSPTKAEAQKMSIPELAALSPAEKFDLFTGRYDYPLKAQVERISFPGARKWEGICHGWAPASINHDEPWPKLLRNPQGIEVPFGSTDIKALLSYYYAYGFEAPTSQMGTRCDPESGSGCGEDLNAGAFHIVLANKLGITGTSFIADIESYGEVWNNPAYGYSSSVLGEFRPLPTSAPGTARVLRVRTDFSFVDNGENSWRPVIGTPLQVIGQRRYEYDLDIDGDGNIIGGKWRSGTRPDFLWVKPRPFVYSGLMFRMGELLNE